MKGDPGRAARVGEKGDQGNAGRPGSPGMFSFLLPASVKDLAFDYPLQ